MKRCLGISALCMMVGVSTTAFSQGRRPMFPMSPPAIEKSEKPQVEVCFVLDTTGSMGGLIEGAKAKIWAIANQIATAKPTPRVKFGLLAYRDRGDSYITRKVDLTEDLDAIYAELQGFQAGGGGDGPESVNQALNEAVTQMKWSTDSKSLRIVFLVGDAPPHMDYANDIAYPQSCEIAARAGLIVNTIQCGAQPDTENIWREIARRAEGQYAAIGQSGDVHVVKTPIDAEIAKLNVEIGTTMLPYGSERARNVVAAKQARAEAAPPAAAADRAGFMAGGGRLMAADESMEGGELLDDLAAKRVDLDQVKDEELPVSLRELPKEKRAARIEELRQQRSAVQAKILELSKQRAEYIQNAMKKQAGAKDGFDLQVARMLAEQAGQKGLTIEKP